MFLVQITSMTYLSYGSGEGRGNYLQITNAHNLQKTNAHRKTSELSHFPNPTDESDKTDKIY